MLGYPILKLMYAVSRKHSTIVWISYVYFYCFEHVVVLVVYMQAHVIAVLVMKIIIIHEQVVELCLMLSLTFGMGHQQVM